MSASSLTYRIASDCPQCGDPLVLRHAKATGHRFVSCSAYPTCRFAESHDPRIDTLVAALDALAERARTTAWPSRQAFADDVAATLAALRDGAGG